MMRPPFFGSSPTDRCTGGLFVGVGGMNDGMSRSDEEERRSSSEEGKSTRETSEDTGHAGRGRCEDRGVEVKVEQQEVNITQSYTVTMDSNRRRSAAHYSTHHAGDPFSVHLIHKQHAHAGLGERHWKHAAIRERATGSAGRVERR
ncbi:hypothetical protein EYF80_028655 [Liparis tanakae]|uniref:Uncharacterized protein n=1 Tax=Liparis tanakae TaxID=230148 RepID=A0A4Z2H5J8_9TELE|nr:hypothetical protein EYF80_028655 [Liparis tanakae]